LRCLVNQEIPLNDGCLKPIKIIIPKDSIMNPSDEAAGNVINYKYKNQVVGGNVLTSQRITDVILKAFKACGASQGYK
jgi:5-oxoprolinase (ATP-hydrolysing)